MILRALAAILLCLGALGCTRPEPARTYANPVLDTDFPDPAVLRTRDGWFYVYATQGERDGRTANIQVARSRDLVRWEHLGDALPVKASWARTTSEYWAPHVAEHGGRYYLYHSAKPDADLPGTGRGLCLAVATAARPEGPFTDMGRPLECGPGFENIDPFAFDDPRTGKRLLYWGSGFGPIKVREFGADRMSWAPGSTARPLVDVVKTEDPTNYRRLVEGAWVTHRAPWYYLYFSGDNCCGPKAHYAIMVARSRSPTGPFEVWTGRPGGVILQARGPWNAPGHNSVIRDDAGRDWMLYHAVDTRRPRSRPGDEINTRRIFLMDPIAYRDGWPRIDGDGPSSGPRPAPFVRGQSSRR